MNKKPKILKGAIVKKFISEADPKKEPSPADLSEEVDSRILVRELVSGSKLEGAYKKKKGTIIGETSHTVSIYSKRDVALERLKVSKTPKSDKKPKQMKAPIRKKATIVHDSSSSDDLGVPSCSCWLDDRATVTAKQPEEIAHEIKAEKTNPEKEYSLTAEKEEKETNSSSNENQQKN